MSTNVGTLTVRLNADATKFVAGLQNATRSIRMISARMAEIGIAATAAAAPLAFLGKRIVQTASTFERAMVRVGAVSQATAQEEAELTKAGLRLAATTEYTANQVATAMDKLGMAGFTAAQNIGAMPSVLQLASAGQLDVAESAQIAASIMKSQKYEVQDLARVNDVLVSAFTGANIVLSDVANAFKFVGAVGQQAGLEFEELTAAVAKMADVGVPAEIAGTSLRGVISKLLAPSKEAKKVFDEVGLSALMLAEDGMPSLVQIVETLEKAMVEVGGETELAGKLMQAFDMRAGAGLVSLVSVGSKKLAEFTKRLKDSGGLAQRIAEKQLNTFDGRMKILISQIEGLAITMGTELMPVVERFAGGLQGAVEWMTKLNPEMRRSLLEFGAFTTAAFAAMAAVSGLLFVMRPLVSALAVAGQLVGAAFTGPALAAAAAVVGLIAAAGTLRMAWESNLLDMRTAWDDLVKAIEDAIPGDKIIDWLGAKVDFLIGKLGDVKDYFSGNNKILVEGIDPETGRTTSRSEIDAPSRSERLRGKNLEVFKEEIAMTFQEAKDNLKASLLAGVDSLKSVASDIGGAALDKLKSAMGEDQFSKLSGFLGGFKDAFLSLIDSIKNGSTALNKLDRSAEKAARTQEKIAKAAQPVTNIWQDLGHAFRKLFGRKQAGKWAGDVFGLAPTKFGTDQFDSGSIASQIPVLDNILQGASAGAAAGGPWGALIGGILGLLMSSEQFATMLEFLNSRLQKLADVAGMVLEGLEPVLGGFSSITSLLMKVIGPLLKQFGDALRPIGGLLMLIGQLLEVVFTMWTSFGASLQVFGAIIEVVSEILFTVINAIMTILMPVLKIIAQVHNAIMGVLQKVFEALSKIPLIGKLFKGLAKSFEKSKIDIEALDASANRFAEQLSDPSGSLERLTDSAQDLYDAETMAADAARDVAESLKNVPEGFKIALRRFQSQDAADGPGGGGPPAGGSSGNGASDWESQRSLGNRTNQEPGSPNYGKPGEPGGPVGRRIATESGMMWDYDGDGQITQTDLDYNAWLNAQPFAAGGIVTRPMLGMVGEAGPEAIIPIDRLLEAIGEGGGVNVENVYVQADDPDELFRKIRAMARRESQVRTGVYARSAPGFTGIRR